MPDTYTSKHDTAVYTFATDREAWTFTHACDVADLAAGFPSLDGQHSVKVSIPTWMARETADRLAGRQPVAYYFAGQVIPHV